MLNDEEFCSADVTALFTSVPIDQALEVVGNKLQEDTSWKSNTNLNIDDILSLTSLCLKCTYFKFNGEFYKQIHGAAMGSPLSPVIANLYMENLETKALTSLQTPPSFYKRYMDDIFIICKMDHTDRILQHFNSQDPSIKFTIEKETDKKLPFLDVLVDRNENGEIITTVYKKKTHTDQYLNYRSEHPNKHKMSVVNTLLHRATKIISTEDGKRKEIESIRNALSRCDYPNWIINKGLTQLNKQNQPQRVEEERNGLAVIPYVKGLGERIRYVLKQYKINTAFKPHRTLRNILVSPKDKIEKENKTCVVYHIKCQCGQDYIGETERQFKERLPEHRRPSNIDKSAMAFHIHTHNHKIDEQQTKILDQDTDWQKRGIKEAIHIRRHNPTLNRDEGRHSLPPLWNSLIVTTSHPQAQYIQPRSLGTETVDLN